MIRSVSLPTSQNEIGLLNLYALTTYRLLKEAQVLSYCSNQCNLATDPHQVDAGTLIEIGQTIEKLRKRWPMF